MQVWILSCVGLLSSMVVASTAAAQTICDSTEVEIVRARPMVESAIDSAEKLGALRAHGAFRAPSDEFLATDQAAKVALLKFTKTESQELDSAQTPGAIVESMNVLLLRGTEALDILDRHINCGPYDSTIRQGLQQIRLRMNERLSEISSEALAKLRDSSANLPNREQQLNLLPLCRTFPVSIQILRSQANLRHYLQEDAAQEILRADALAKTYSQLCS